jgi:hypothetical protein
LAQPDVLAGYRQADLFVLASKLAKDGDRDGLPNVLIEAQSQRLACVSTNVSGIPELIQQGVTGVLTPPDDPVALAQMMAELIRDPARRAALGAAGELRVRSLFSMELGIDALARRFGLNRSGRSAAGPLDPPLSSCRSARPAEEWTTRPADYLPLDVFTPPRSEPTPPSSACASPFTRR